MKRIGVLAVVVLISASITLAQSDTVTYSGQGITFDYPAEWSLEEGEGTIRLWNTGNEPDLFDVSSKKITVSISTGANSRTTYHDESVAFRLAYGAGSIAGAYGAQQAYRAQLVGIEIPAEQVSFEVGEIEQIDRMTKPVYMLRETVTVLVAAEFLLITDEDRSYTITASAPAGELDSWIEAVLSIVETIEVQ